jgi:DNA repair exonuclease SbcCD nuclease subunit
VKEIVSSERPDVIVFLGDIFDNPRPPEELQYAFASLVNTFLLDSREVVIITGNHDWSNSSHSLMWLEAFERRLEGLYIAAKPKIIKTKSGVSFGCYPWCPKIGEWVEKDKLPYFVCETDNLPVDYLIGHFAIKKAKLQKRDRYSVIAEEGISLDACHEAIDRTKAKNMVVGHMHLAQDFGDFKSILVPGSINRINFNDRDHKKLYVSVVDGELGWGEVPKPIEMVEINDEGSFDDDVSHLAGKVIKVNIEGASQEFVDQFDEREIRRRLENVKPLEISSIRVVGKKRTTNKDLNEKKRKYGGTLHSAIKSYIEDTYGNLSEDDRKELLKKAIEIS